MEHVDYLVVGAGLFGAVFAHEAKKAGKKKDFKKPSISELKAKMELSMKNSTDYVNSVADKPMTFIPLPDAFSEAIKLPGIPMGYLSIVTGWSNTGKSTIKNCLIASCINNGILPMGAVAVSKKIVEKFRSENDFIFHLSTQNGNAMCCRAALATIHVPNTLFLIASFGLSSIKGTCLCAAAWNTTLTGYSSKISVNLFLSRTDPIRKSSFIPS